jgi:hypothetical protein
MMYNIPMEILGYGVGIIMSIITAGFLWSDIYFSPKSTDPVLLVLLISILFGVISLIIFGAFLSNTQYQYSKKGGKIRLTKETRAKLNKFRDLYLYGYFAIALLSLMFFLIYKNPDTGFEKFFKIPTAFFSTDSIIFAIKVLLSMGTLGITSSMIYTANDLKKQNIKQLYIPDDEGADGPHNYPYKYKRKRTNIIDDINGFFRNVNFDYVVNYNIERT